MGVDGYVCAVTLNGGDLAAKFSASLFGRGGNTLMREMVALSNIQSDHIVCLRGYFVDEKNNFNITMELADMSLRGWTQEYHNVNTAHRFINEVIQGVYDIHRHGFVHRDLKPDNILIINNHATICDFGMSILSEQYKCQDVLLHSIGTLTYNSPETILPINIDSKPIDIWALGCTIFMLVVAESMFGYSDSGKDQLIKIFGMFGTKVPEEWVRHIDKLDIDLNSVVPNLAPLDKIREFLTEKQMGLFLRMFDYDIAKRITIEELLKEWSVPAAPVAPVAPVVPIVVPVAPTIINIPLDNRFDILFANLLTPFFD